MKKLAAVLVCLVILIGCSKSSTDDSSFKYPFSVLLLLPGPTVEQSLDKRASDAMQKIGKELKVNIICMENVEPTQVKQIVAEAVNKKIDFVVGMGEQLTSPLTQAALKYPYVKFAVVGRYSGNFRNFGSLSYQTSYFYLAGSVAALKSKSGKIGSLVDDNQMTTKEEVDAFISGAKRVNPQIEMYNVILDNNDTDNLALKCTEAFKKQNVDVIYVNCNQSGVLVHKWAAENRIFTIGYLDDQYKLAPKAVLTSVVIDMHKLLSFGTEQAMIGKWQGRAYRFGMTDNISSLAILRGVLDTKQEGVFEGIYRELVAQRGEFPGMVN